MNSKVTGEGDGVKKMSESQTGAGNQKFQSLNVIENLKTLSFTIAFQSVEGSYDYQTNKVPRRVREP